MLFFESGDTGVFKDDRNKLFAIFVMKSKMTTILLMLDMLYSYMSVVCIYHCKGSAESFR